MPNSGAFPLGAAFALGDHVLWSEGQNWENPRAQDDRVCSGVSGGTERTPQTMPFTTPPPQPQPPPPPQHQWRSALSVRTETRLREKVRRKQGTRERRQARLRRHLLGSESRAVSHLGSGCSAPEQPSPFPGPGQGIATCQLTWGKTRASLWSLPVIDTTGRPEGGGESSLHKWSHPWARWLTQAGSDWGVCTCHQWS